MNAIATITPPMSVPDMERLAVAIAKSGLFGMRTPEQALVLMAIAQAEGRHPVEAARDYDVIQGRPAKKAEAMLRDFIQAGGKVEWHSLTDELADATLTHPQTGSVRIDWDMKRAMTAFGKKEMYTKFPRQMLRSRVVSEGVRTLWPLATSGMYVESEVAAMEQHNGPTLEASPEREAINAEVSLKNAAAGMTRAEKIEDKSKVYDTSPTDADKWWFNLETKLATAQSQAEVMKIGELKSVKTARASTVPGVQERIMELLANAYARFPTDSKTWTEDLSDEALGEVTIAGEANVMAGD